MFGLRCRDCLCTYIDPPISTSLDFIEKVTNFWQVVGTIKMLQTDYYGRREKNYWKAIGEMKNKRSFFCTVDLKDSNVMAIGNTTNIVREGFKKSDNHHFWGGGGESARVIYDF